MQTQKTNKNNKILWIAVYLLIFAGMFIFFGYTHKLIVFDSDDWLFASFTRSALPEWKSWNPTRILPETFMSFCAGIGAHYIYPFTHDYIGAMAFVFAFVLSVLITLYFRYMVKYTIHKMKLTDFEMLCVLATSILLHFVIYKRFDSSNMHMFSEANVTCIFFYTIPAIVNVITVLSFAVIGEINFFKKGSSTVTRAFLLLMVYLSINSNMFQSIILISYVGMYLLLQLLKIMRKRKSVKLSLALLLRKNVSAFIIIVCWCVSLVYEAGGGRADDAASTGIIANLGKSISNYFDIFFVMMNRTYILVTGVFILMAFSIFIFTKNKREWEKKYAKTLIYCTGTIIITSVYLILLTAKTNPDYLKRSGVIFGITFYIMIIGVISMAYVFKRTRKVIVVMPLVIFILLNKTIYISGTFTVINSAGYYENKCKEIDEYIIDRVTEADKKGKTEVTVKIPKYKTEDNWPVACYGNNFMADTLYRHGVTTRRMAIYMEPDKAINKKFGID